MKNNACKLVLLLLSFTCIPSGIYAQHKIHSSISFAPVVSFLNPYDLRYGFDRYRADLYDYNQLSRGFKVGYTARISLSSRASLKLNLDIQEEKYTLTQNLRDDSIGVSGKFVNINRFSMVYPSFGISYLMPKLDSIFLFLGYGYKRIFFIGGSTFQYENLQNGTGALAYSQTTNSPLNGYGCITIGFSKFTKSRRFEYGLFYQMSKGTYPKIYYKHQIGSTISEGWSSPKVNCLLFQLNYNFGKRL